MPGAGVVKAYHGLVHSGALTPDPAQEEAVHLLEGIAADLASSASKRGRVRPRLFKARLASSPVQGAYIWGAVGRGKSMLMDLFFAHVPIAAKRRLHFHEFMDEVHAAIAAYRREGGDKAGRRDPVPVVSKPIIETTRLLCLDEFHVTDITNAMLLHRLFAHLFEAGVVLVATSNVQPDRLYENGLNRQLFLPFIDLLKAHATVLHLASPTDYRMEKLTGQQVYFIGAGAAARAAMDAMWTRLTGGADPEPGAVTSLGRQIAVPAEALGVARFDFADLCEQPLGARDYLRLARTYEAFIVDNVPQFDRSRSNAAKRFIQFIDTLYDRGVKLAASFAVPLDALGADRDTAFEFQRCVSRLTEMQSEAYLTAAPTRTPSSGA